VSLVGDALRRARAEAGERRGVAIPPGLGPPIRRSLLGGPVVVGLVLVAVAAAAAALAWWLAGGGAGTPAPASPARVAHAVVDPTAPARLAEDAAPGRGAPESAPAAAATGDGRPVPAEAMAAAAADGAPPPGGPAAPPAGARFPAAAPAATAAPPTPATTAAPPATGARDFVIDAELGYARLHLDYLVYKPSAPFARLNGRDVVVGSIVDGFRVVEIGPDFVRLADARGPVILRVR